MMMGYLLCVLAACPGVAETVQHVTVTKETYGWVLGIPSKNLNMNFQEVRTASHGTSIYLDELGPCHRERAANTTVNRQLP